MKELEDFSWFPQFLRHTQTEFIGNFAVKTGFYKPFINYLKTAGIKSKSMFDLCSGIGQPAEHIFKQSGIFDKLTLSDKFPDPQVIESFDGTYISSSIDANTIQFDAQVYYTMFNAFHHFNDREKIEMIDRIIRSDSKACFVEILEPTFLCLIKVLFATTIGVILFSPFVTKMNLKSFFFTYILPINVLTISIDGVISVLKSKSISKYKELLVNHIDQLEISKLNGTLGPLTIIRIRS